MNDNKIIVTFFAPLPGCAGFAQGGRITVGQGGSGQVTSIQAASNSLSDSASSTRMIVLKKGRYLEKLFITRHQIVPEGKDREETRTVQNIACDEWRYEHPNDWGVATLNLDGNDTTLLNLTIASDYGVMQTELRTMACKTASTGKKLLPKNGRQMALRSMTTTRLKVVGCRFGAWAENHAFYTNTGTTEPGTKGPPTETIKQNGWLRKEPEKEFANSDEADRNLNRQSFHT